MARLMARPLTAMLALSRAAAFLGPSPHKKPTVATPRLAEREEKWEPPEFDQELGAYLEGGSCTHEPSRFVWQRLG